MHGGVENQARLIKKIQVNFDELYVAAIANRIIVYEAKQLKPIDILSEHRDEIHGLDVAQMLRNIVSFSRAADGQETTFMVHCPVDSIQVREQETEDQVSESTCALQDQAVYMGRLKWQQTYSVTLGKFRVPQTLAISLLGDFCVMGGDQFMSIWTIDSLMDSYTLNLLFAKEPSEDKNEVTEECESLSGRIVQAEICGSGRMFATLDEDSKSLKIWYNDDCGLQRPAQGDVNFRRFHIESALIEPYEMPKHRFKLQSFKFLPAVGGQYDSSPSALLTVTARKAFVWVESLASEQMAFNCVQSFDIYHDACFLEIQKMTPRADKHLRRMDLRNECSAIFHSYNDKVKHAKAVMNSNQNTLGIVPSALGGTESSKATLDWLLLLNSENQMTLVQCKGLRSCPQSQPEFRKLRQISLGHPEKQPELQRLQMGRLMVASMRRPGTFDDTFGVLSLSATGLDLVKSTITLPSIHSQLVLGGQAEQTAKVEFNAAISMPASKSHKVDKMVPHPSLPLVALVYKELRMIKVHQLDEQNNHPSIHEPGFNLHGTHYLSNDLVVDVQWVGDLDQLLVQVCRDDENWVELIASEASAKLVSTLGDRMSLQKEADRVLQNNANLAGYRTMHRWKLDESFGLGTPHGLIPIHASVLPTQSGDIRPLEQIYFAVIGETGASLSYQLSFQIDQNLQIQNQELKQMDKSQPFVNGFTLTKVVASRRQQTSTDFAYTLCLSQKAPKVWATSANYRGPVLKPEAQLHLISFSSTGARQEVFVAPGKAEELLEQPVIAKFSSSMLGVLVRQGIYEQEAPHIYLYDLQKGTYSGFLDLNQLVGGMPAYRAAADFVFLEEKSKGAIAYSCKDRVHILYQKQTSWEVLQKSEALTNAKDTNDRQLVSLTGLDGTSQTLVSLIDNQVLMGHSEAQILSLARKQTHIAIPSTQLLHQQIIARQRSQSLFAPGLLSELFFKGYSDLVIKVLLKLKELLEPKNEQDLAERFSDYLDMDLESLLTELKTQVEAMLARTGQAQQAPQAAQPKKAFNVFDDLDDSLSDSSSEEEKKEEEKKEEDPKKKFKEGAEDLARLLASDRAMTAMGLDKIDQVRQLLIFIFKFKNIFELDFYADPLASQLLRRVFFETEMVDTILIDEIMARLQPKIEESKAGDDEQGEKKDDFLSSIQVKKVAAFSMEEFMAEQSNEPQVKSVGDLGLVTDWSSAMVCQALHSDNQEVVMNYLSERFSFDKNMTWNVMRKLCIPLWLKSTAQIKKYIEFVAKTEYRINEGSKYMCKADHTAIWYTLLGKKSVLQNLYSLEHGQDRFAEFFQKDFSLPKVRSIAQKNGMALVGKQKFHVACAFLILAEKLDSAVQVALDRLNDPVLAVLMCRITDPEDKSGCLDKVLTKWFIERGNKLNDPFLVNIGFWLKKEYIKSVNMLNPKKEESAIGYFYQNDMIEFNLSADPKLIQPVKQQDKAQNIAIPDQVYPIVSKRDYVIIDLIKRLRQAPDVKRALNMFANQGGKGKGGGGGGSIFDDYFDGSDSSSEEEVQPKEQIEVNEVEVLKQAIGQTLLQRQTVIALILIEENRSLVKDMDRTQVDKISRTLLLDLVVNILHDKNSGQSIKQLAKGLDLLAKQLSLDSKVQSEQFLFRQLHMMGLLKLRIEFLVEQITQSKSESQKQIMEEVGLQILEDQTRKLSAIAQALRVCGGQALVTEEKNLAGNEALLRLCEAIEAVIDCALILSYTNPDSFVEVAGGSASRDVNFGRQAKPEMRAEQSPIKVGNRFNGLNSAQLMSPGDDGMVEDSDEEEARAIITQRLKNQANGTNGLGHSHEDAIWSSNCEDCSKEDAANAFLSMFRTKLNLVVTLQSIAIFLGKLSMADKLTEGVKLILCVHAYADQIERLAVNEPQLQALKQNLSLNQLKEHLLKIKGTVKRNVEHMREVIRENVPLNEQRQSRKDARNIHPQQQGMHDFLNIWFNQLVVSRTNQQLKHDKLSTIKLLGSRLLTRQQDSQATYLQRMMLRNGELGVIRQFSSNYEKMEASLLDSATYTYANVLSSVDQRLISSEIEDIIDNRYRQMGKSISFAYFFSNPDKLKNFATSHELGQHHEHMKDLQLSLTSMRCEDSKGHLQVDSAIQNSLFGTGIELFKQRQESVVDMCFDQTGNHDMMAMAIQARGMREISVVDTLIYRNRRDGGLEMMDEDHSSWSECLHRYEQIQQHLSDLKPKYDAVRAALYSSYYHATLSQMTKTQRPQNSILVDMERSTPQMWDQQPIQSYLKTYSNLNITHDDYTNAITAHPHLPIYLTGNAKGLVCAWAFNQMADKSLNQWLLDKETPPAAANPKKATVKHIEFNAYGDKFLALNTGGNFFVMSFDLEQQSKTEAVYSTLMTPRLSEHRLSEVAFLERDSIIVGLSHRDKVVNIYDTLLAPKNSVVMSFKNGPGGNIMQLCPDSNRILCFNSKPGYVAEYDLRKESEAVRTKQLTREEITAVALSPDQRSLIVGQADGLIKTFDLAEVLAASQPDNAYSRDYVATVAEQSTLNAFGNYGSKRAGVTSLKFHPKTGALFAASNLGVVKLLRLAI